MDTQQPPQRPNVFLIILATVGVLTIIGGIMTAIFVFSAISSVSSAFQSIPGNSSAGGIKISGRSKAKGAFTTPKSGDQYIAGIKLVGEINDAVADDVIEKLESAEDDPNAVGILLEVNSPGGAVVPSQQIYDTIKELKTVKPVVTYVREMAASGAYYSTAPSNAIVATRGSLIGSIGVILNGVEAYRLIDYLKINTVTLKTGALKDAGSPTRPMNNADKKYLQSLINATRAQFAADVKAARKTSKETMDNMSDGRVVLAPEALNLKLIDKVGSRDDALDVVTKLAGLKKVPRLFYYENIQSFSDLLSQRLSHSVSQALSETAKDIMKSTTQNAAPAL